MKDRKMSIRISESDLQKIHNKADVYKRQIYINL